MCCFEAEPQVLGNRILLKHKLQRTKINMTGSDKYQMNQQAQSDMPVDVSALPKAELSASMSQ